MEFERAIAYSDRHAPAALTIVRDGTVVYASHAPDVAPGEAHALYSGTKSFWGVCAVVARDEGLLDLDETVGATFDEWSHGARAAVTLRHLLSLTAGIPFGGLGNAVPSYERALATDVLGAPGGRFTYGGIPLQVFGAVLARKLADAGLSPHDYLRARVLDPIGLRVERWRTLRDGTHPLPTGAFLRLEEWVKFGELIANDGRAGERDVVRAASLHECFEGSHPNPRYGLGFWLSPLPERKDVVYASGSGGQALYVFRAERIVVARFGAGGSFKHEPFLKALAGDIDARRSRYDGG